MINERVFAAQFSDFWRSSLPNLEVVTRSANLGYERISAPFKPKSNPYRRDLISESGYRLFFTLLNTPGSNLEDARRSAVSEAKEFLAVNFAHGGEPIDDIGDGEASEIDSLVRWLAAYFARFDPSSWRDKVSIPVFKGHGIISACRGDFLIADDLIEMKYVDRSFRSHDLRQVIVYSALRYFENGELFKNIRMVNPFLGLEFTTNPREIIYSSSGLEVAEFFQELSYVVSSGEVSH